MGTRRAPRRKSSGKKPRQSRALAKTPLSKKSAADFQVIAIGASAGGLEAFRTFLTDMPAGKGMSFILVQHLDPTHSSMMVDLLRPHTTMTVLEARDGMKLEPDHIYLIPPGRYLTVRNGALQVSRPPQDAQRQTVRLPFDYLLQSLATELGERAVCIVLSGTATDGSAGARMVKAVGGLVIAQDPEEAEYDGMPRSAIASGAVDLVLRLSAMPSALLRYAGHRYVKTTASDPAAPLGDGITKIIDLLRTKTSHNFALYKEGTIGRRIERRMALAGTEDTNRYLKQLTQDPAELQRLANDLFINVTRFFRDEKAFDLLAEKVIPDLVRAQPPDRPIRVWVAGCSTGEEAYSLAILILEKIAASQRKIKLQIFASDIDEDAVAIAREGLYPVSIEADMSPDRLSRYFSKEDLGYRVTRDLRAMVAFSVHDLIADAPFSRLDLVSCRNLLIYLRPEVQQKVIGLFHFALRAGGVLFLGTSETIGSANDHFEPISKVLRIYTHLGRSRPGEVELPLGRGEAARSLWLRPTRPVAPHHSNVSEFAQRLLIETYAPASVLANRRHQGLYYFGAMDRYLKLPTGVASQDVMSAAREGLRPAIRSAFEKVGRGHDEAIVIIGSVRRNASLIPVTISAKLVKNDGEELVLLSFRDSPAQQKRSKSRPESVIDLPRVAELERELDTTRHDLESAIRERETADEEIRAINEEAMSVNEEFQTTNEELETSKEELQSLNEELTALNGQLQETLDQNKVVTNDLENILNSADVATLFLDETFNIRFFTPAAKSLFSVIATDVGRPITDLARHFADKNIFIDCRAVLTNLIPITREIKSENGAWFTCRILPYRTKENHIEGVVLTFVDVTARKKAEDAAHLATRQAENANLGKSTFLAAASHDLRQPLQTLVLLNGVMAKEHQDEKTQQLLARGDEALTAMSGMLNTLLDINQLEAGVIRPHPVDFPVSDLLEHLQPEFAYHTQIHGLEWRVLPCRLAIRSDPRLLEQMIRNLLSNAVKYTKKGGILVGCRQRGAKLRIEIWDTGLGIPEKQLRAIFGEFYQIDNPARDLSRGLGLGLAIVQRLGELLDHRVDVRSRHGTGSVFAIEVPLAPEGRVVAKPNARTPRTEASVRGGLILIVDDDPGVRETLALFLKAAGYQTTTASDGEEAVALASSTGIRPDMVIMDYNLPKGQTGVDVMSRLRAVFGADLHALFLTGDISTETLSDLDRQGYVHRSKPISAEELTQIIGSFLSLRRTNSRDALHAEGIGKAHPETVFVVDDDDVVREAMRALLEAEGMKIEDFASGEAFFAAHPSDVRGLLLVDATMPGMSGLTLLQRLKDENYALPSVMITGNSDLQMAVQAIKAGASDFIEKPVGGAELIASIERAMTPPQDSENVAAHRELARTRLASLTTRERQIMDLILAGHPNKNIAADLEFTERTIERYRAAIMKKMGTRSLAALVRLALAAI